MKNGCVKKKKRREGGGGGEKRRKKKKEQEDIAQHAASTNFPNHQPLKQLEHRPLFCGDLWVPCSKTSVSSGVIQMKRQKKNHDQDDEYKNMNETKSNTRVRTHQQNGPCHACACRASANHAAAPAAPAAAAAAAAAARRQL